MNQQPVGQTNNNNSNPFMGGAAANTAIGGSGG